jgi:two-component system NtrC family sensor kinase
MKQNPYAGLKKVILAGMILVPLVPFALVLLIGNHYFTTSLENNTIASMRRIVKDHRQMIESFLMERKADLEFILTTYSFEDLSRPDKLQRTFENLQKESHVFVDLGIFDESGLHVAYHGPYQLSGKCMTKPPGLKRWRETGFISATFFSVTVRCPILSLPLPR